MLNRSMLCGIILLLQQCSFSGETDYVDRPLQSSILVPIDANFIRKNNGNAYRIQGLMIPKESLTTYFGDDCFIINGKSEQDKDEDKFILVTNVDYKKSVNIYRVNWSGNLNKEKLLHKRCVFVNNTRYIYGLRRDVSVPTAEIYEFVMYPISINNKNDDNNIAEIDYDPNSKKLIDNKYFTDKENKEGPSNAETSKRVSHDHIRYLFHNILQQNGCDINDVIDNIVIDDAQPIVCPISSEKLLILLRCKIAGYEDVATKKFFYMANIFDTVAGTFKQIKIKNISTYENNSINDYILYDVSSSGNHILFLGRKGSLLTSNMSYIMYATIEDNPLDNENILCLSHIIPQLGVQNVAMFYKAGNLQPLSLIKSEQGEVKLCLLNDYKFNIQQTPYDFATYALYSSTATKGKSECGEYNYLFLDKCDGSLGMLGQSTDIKYSELIICSALNSI